jgi:hypothetical protein
LSRLVNTPKNASESERERAMADALKRELGDAIELRSRRAACSSGRG